MLTEKPAPLETLNEIERVLVDTSVNREKRVGHALALCSLYRASHGDNVKSAGQSTYLIVVDFGTDAKPELYFVETKAGTTAGEAIERIRRGDVYGRRVEAVYEASPRGYFSDISQIVARVLSRSDDLSPEARAFCDYCRVDIPLAAE